MSDILTGLEAVKELLSDEKRWTKGVWARDKSGERVSISSPNAVCFCMIGAISKLVHSRHFFIVEDALHVAVKEDFLHLAVFNDAPTTTHSDIMSLIQRAIDAEKAKL